MINLYKRLDVFRCTHESHQGFGSVVSVYHVFKEKDCYPKGCVYFKWMCRKLNHKQSCHKSYKHVGKKCPPCTHYYDEKIVRVPKLLLSKRDYDAFLRDLQKFETWLYSKKGRVLSCAGTIKTIKPRFLLTYHNKQSSLSFRGFLLTFYTGFIDITHFQDSFYAHLKPAQFMRLRLGEGDRLEFKGTLRVDRGRLILDRVHAIEIEEKNSKSIWGIEKARCALFVGKLYDYQYEKCLQCEYGSLVDVTAPSHSMYREKRRKLLCMKGIENPEHCIFPTIKDLYEADNCQISIL